MMQPSSSLEACRGGGGWQGESFREYYRGCCGQVEGEGFRSSSWCATGARWRKRRQLKPERAEFRRSAEAEGEGVKARLLQLVPVARPCVSVECWRLCGPVQAWGAQGCCPEPGRLPCV